VPEKKKKKLDWKKYIPLVFSVLIGGACGFLIVKYLGSALNAEKTLAESLWLIVVLILQLYAAIFLQIVIHEAGHLVFGLMTGYRYSSFRVGSFMWVKEHGRLKFKRLSIAGTGGQCLMVPPEAPDGKTPFVLYNLGGSIINIVSSIISLELYYIFREIPYVSAFFLLLSMIGFAFALLNGIPMKLGLVNNDGHNAMSFGKDRGALRSFVLQLKVVEQTTNGVRLKDMPEEWFVVPPPEEMKNSMTAAMGTSACNRLMDGHSFEEADRLMEKLVETGSLLGLHQNLIICDRIYCELIGENRQAVLETMLDKQQKKMMKAMKKFPPILRTEYSYALLAEKDMEKAAGIIKQFEKAARSYPYQCDIESERELIAIANLAAERQKLQ